MSATTNRPCTVPADAVLIVQPYSEVCVHMRVAGKPMWVEPVRGLMAQLYTLEGVKFSFPICRGEAGLRYES
jgi:hypothetical protein